MSETSGAQQRKNMDYAPLVGNFRGSTEKKHGLRPACRKLPGLNREKTRITPRLSETSGAQQRKNVDYKAFRNVGYNKCRDAHRGRMFRLLWTFVDLKLPSAMSHAIHKIVSKERCQSYFIDGCRRIKIERNNLLCEQAPTEVFRSIFAWLVAMLTFQLQQLLQHLVDAGGICLAFHGLHGLAYQEADGFLFAVVVILYGLGISGNDFLHDFTQCAFVIDGL